MPIRFNPCSPCCIKVPITLLYCGSRAFFNNLRDLIEGAKVELLSDLTNVYATYYSDSNGVVLIDNLGPAARMRITLPKDGYTQTFVMGGNNTLSLTPVDGSQAAFDAAKARNLFFFPAPAGTQCCFGSTWIDKTTVLHAKFDSFVNRMFRICAGDLNTVHSFETNITWRSQFTLTNTPSPTIISNCWVGKVSHHFGTLPANGHFDCVGDGSDFPIENAWVVFQCDSISVYVNTTGNDGIGGNGPIWDGDPCNLISSSTASRQFSSVPLPSLTVPLNLTSGVSLVNSLHPFYFRYAYPFTWLTTDINGRFVNNVVNQIITVSEATP